MKNGLVRSLIGLHGFSSCGKTTVLRRFVQWLVAKRQWTLMGVYNCETGEPCEEGDYSDLAAILTHKDKAVIVFTEGDYKEDPLRVENFCTKIGASLNLKMVVVVAAMRVGHPNIVHWYSDWASTNDIEMVTILKRKTDDVDESYMQSVILRLATELDVVLEGERK